MAGLPVMKDLESFRFEDSPVNAALVRSLHEGSFLAAKRNRRTPPKRGAQARKSGSAQPLGSFRPARIVCHGRYVVFQMAEVAVPRGLFDEILQRINRLRPQPPPLAA